jgi:DivIVA domain-containing protein
MRMAPEAASRAGRERMIKAARSIEFPVSMRGYDRRAVDNYVEQVNRLIAELEMSCSPDSAVRHALEKVSEETHELLQHAHQTADEITGRAQREADELRRQGEKEAEGAREHALREADQVLAGARRDAEALLSTARRNADELLRAAESRARDLAHNTETVWRERRRLLEDVKAVGEQLVGIGEAECKRFPGFDEHLAAVAESAREPEGATPVQT